MSLQLFLEQTLNGVQLGVMLFLIAAGLTLVLGIMNLLNLTHSSFYMLGAYIASALYGATGSFFVALAGAIGCIVVLAQIMESLVMRYLYDREHLYQLLATFGLMLFLNEMATIVWGLRARYFDIPPWLGGTVEIVAGVPYPKYRLAVTCVSLLIGGVLYFGIRHTRIGMLIRAGASNKTMLSALGVNVDKLYAFVFCLSAAMAAVAGMMVAPLVSIDSGMGDSILILCFVVIVVGGLGSVRGAFVGSILVGLVDTFGRMLMPMVFGFPLGPALSSMFIYLFMAVVLLIRPEGLFPGRS